MAIIGIDLGTSNSAAAVLRVGRPVIIPSAKGISIGGKAFPSYVALTVDAGCYEVEKMLANFADKLTDDLKKRIESALRETKEALLKKDVAFATESAEALKKVLQEAGAVLYSQSGQASKGDPYVETRWKGPEPVLNVGAAAGEPRPSGAGPRGKVMNAEYKENK